MLNNVLAVMSGKGGVGKSTAAFIISKVLEDKGNRVLLIDMDICGPSVSLMVRNENKVLFKNNSYVPIEHSNSFSFFSFGNMIKKDDVIIWRGSKKKAMLDKMLGSFFVSNCYDYIIIDTPPGLSEEHSVLLQYNPKVVIVSTSQNLSLNDTQNTINFAIENQLTILGIIQNCTKILCPCCNKHTYLFGKDGSYLLAKEYKIPTVCELDFDTEIYKLIENKELYGKVDKTDSYQKIKAFVNIYY